MKVRVRRPYLGAEGKTHRGQELEMSEQRFQQLTTGIHAVNPLVDPVEVGYKMLKQAPKNKMESAPQNKRRLITLDSKLVAEGLARGIAEAAKTGTADPSSLRPAGGQTGEATDVSSSALARQPAKRKYTRRKGKSA